MAEGVTVRCTRRSSAVRGHSDLAFPESAAPEGGAVVANALRSLKKHAFASSHILCCYLLRVLVEMRHSTARNLKVNKCTFLVAATVQYEYSYCRRDSSTRRYSTLEVQYEYSTASTFVMQ